MQQPILKVCYRCYEKVHQFEDNRFGCDNCKTVYKYKNNAWYVVKEDKEKASNDDRRNKQEH